MKRLLFIYNPTAGKGEIRGSLSYILEEFSGRGYEVVVHPTTRAMDATRVMQEWGDSFDMIVCSGGDGTLDEVVTGMLSGRFSRPVGYIPAGSTNDYASSLGLPMQLQSAAKAIMEGTIYPCDIGRMNDSYFVYVAAFGAFTHVSYDTPQDMKNMLGHMAYVIRGMMSLPTLRAFHAHFESQEQSGTGDFLVGMVTNSNSVAGFRGITGPNVDLNDGLFEVTLVRMPAVPAVEWPGILTALMNGGTNKYLVTFKTARLEFWFDEEVSWTRDGEFGGNHRHLVIENLPRALPIIIPGRTQSEIDEAARQAELNESLRNLSV